MTVPARRIHAHMLRRMDDGRWVCRGGKRPPHGEPCPFATRDYAAAVDHATTNNATPPDMPRDLWVTA